VIRVCLSKYPQAHLSLQHQIAGRWLIICVMIRTAEEEVVVVNIHAPKDIDHIITHIQHGTDHMRMNYNELCSCIIIHMRHDSTVIIALTVRIC